MDQDDNSFIPSTEKMTSYPSPGARLALALSKAQAKFVAPRKTKHVDYQPERGPRVKYSYADLADVIAAVQGPLTENELAVTHILCYLGEMFGLKTILAHSSGEFIETWYPLPDPKKENIRAQAFGSALTYARRYSLSSLVGIASDEDDDGQGAPQTEPPKGNQPPQKPKNHAPQGKPPVPPKPPEDDLDAALGHPPDEPPKTGLDLLMETMDKHGVDNEEMPGIINRVTGEKLRGSELSNEQIQKVIEYIQKFKQGRKG